MTNLDLPPASENFGYPGYIHCSTDKAEAFRPLMESGRSVIWREPNQDPAIFAYAKELCTSPVHSLLMSQLHELSLSVKAGPSGKLIAKYVRRGRVIGGLEDKEEFALDDIFTGANAQPFIRSLDDMVATARVYISNTPALSLSFKTMNKGKTGFHAHKARTAGTRKGYVMAKCFDESGSEYGPKEAFELVPNSIDGDEYEYLGTTPLRTTYVGDNSVFTDIPHCSVKPLPGRTYRLCVIVY